jgi:hypothetical protein
MMDFQLIADKMIINQYIRFFVVYRGLAQSFIEILQNYYENKVL